MMDSKATALRMFGLLLLGLLLTVQPGFAAAQVADPDIEVDCPEVDQADEKVVPETEPPAKEAPPESEPPVVEAPPAAVPAVEDAEPFKLIKMFAEEWKWTPNQIRVPVGTKVRIEFLSYGATRKFELKAYKLKVLLVQDKPTSVEFVADKKGTFRWRCGRPCGNGCAKMTGKLIVE
jgi:cytochrome c oxidase subunit 2